MMKLGNENKVNDSLIIVHHSDFPVCQTFINSIPCDPALDVFTLMFTGLVCGISDFFIFIFSTDV